MKKRLSYLDSIIKSTLSSILSESEVMQANEFCIDDEILNLTLLIWESTLLDKDRVRDFLTDQHKTILLNQHKLTNQGYCRDDIMF